MTAFLQFAATGLATGCSFALVATGFVAIHRITRVVNFAQGTFPVLAGLTGYSLLRHGLPHPAAELLAVAVAGAAGLLVGLIAIGRRHTPPLASLIATIGVGIFAYAIEIAIFGDLPQSFDGWTGRIEVAGVVIQKQYLLIVVVTAAAFAAMIFFFNRTYLGKALTACASNPFAARMVGINVTRMGLAAFVIGGLLGGLAGVLVTPIRPVDYGADVEIAVNGFAAAIFGGLNRPGAALSGGLVLGVIEAMVAGYWNAAYQTAVALAILLALLIWQSGRHRAAD